ncbi:MAG: M50 family metallopeptidase [bacterium]
MSDILGRFNLSLLINIFHRINFKDINSLAVELILLLLVVFIVSFLIDFFFSRSFIGRKYRIFVGPGVIIHEFSHAIMCLLTGAKIKKIRLFDKDGGSVEHTQSRIPIIGPILISFAPFLFGGCAIYFLSKLIGMSEISFNILNLDKNLFNIVFEQAIKLMHFDSIQSYLIFYLIISVIITMTPSLQDLKNSLVPLIISIVAISIYLYITNFHTLMPEVWLIRVISIISTLLILLLLCLFLSIITYIFSKLFRLD